LYLFRLIISFFCANIDVRVFLLVNFKENFEMRNTSIISSSQQTNNKLNSISRKVLCSNIFVRGVTNDWK